MKSDKSFIRLVRSFFLYLIVFLLPTQLALHFWPSSSYVFGIRVDYLSPAIYLTDLLVLGYIVLSLKNLKNIFKNKRNIFFAFIVFIVVVLNCIFSQNLEVCVVRWFKVIGFILFSVVLKHNESYKISNIINTFLLSSFLFGAIGIAQVVKGSTLGGMFYFLGERTFGVETPGISTINLFGEKTLRAYSTFSHPNSLAGYFLILGVLSVFNNKYKGVNKYLRALGITTSTLLILISFSKNVLFTLIFLCLLYLWAIRVYINKNIKRLAIILKTIVFIFLLLSILLPVISSKDFTKQSPFGEVVTKTFNSERLDERLEMYDTTGYVVSDKFYFGVGLNNFVVYLPKVYFYRIPIWQLQPVHNIYLLLLSELGIFVFTFIVLLLLKYIRYLLDRKLTVYLMVLFAILFTGLFDHYWITLQQNLLLGILTLGLSLNKQNL